MEEKIADSLIQLSGADEKERNIIIYGLDIFIYNLTTTLIFLFFGFLTNTLLETVLFLVIHVAVQRKAGGYHASTRLGCFIVTAVSWFGAVMAAKLQEQHCFLSFSAVILLGMGRIAVISFCAPVEHKNKPLTDEVKKQNRIISTVLVTVFSVLLLALWFYMPAVSGTILATLLEITVYILIWKGGRKYVA